MSKTDSRTNPITPSFGVLGVKVNAVQIPDVIELMEHWISGGRNSHFIAVTNVHVVMEAQHDGSFKRALASAHLIVPDGMPLVWLGRLRGHSLHRRVYGPDLLMDFCRQTHKKSYSHFFFGGSPGVPEEAAERLKRQFPGMRIQGTYSPPFRPLSEEEDACAIRMINDAAPDVLWVGLGCPKQERWMYEHYDRLKVPVIVGVGQAFDLSAGRKRGAPQWMREHGLEWLFRLAHDPRRLWRRYLIYNSQFLYFLFLELFKLKQFE
jgi:N-acetylglucosaminyldiphosphoundecaprenol N-acetyl-beta-D-mannosaminyltransferase